MPRFKRLKRRRRKKWFFLAIYTGGLIFVLVLLILGNLKLIQERKSLSLEVEGLKNKVEGILQEREALQSKISQSQSPDYLEKIAREDLNLKKEGEKVVAFPVVEQEQKGIDTEEEKNFFQKILEKLKIE